MIHYKEVLLIHPADASLRGFAAAAPIFVSPYIYRHMNQKETYCRPCNKFLQPVIYESGKVTAGQHFHLNHPYNGGIYIQTANTREGLQNQLRSGFGGWFCLVTPLGYCVDLPDIEGEMRCEKVLVFSFHAVCLNRSHSITTRILKSGVLLNSVDGSLRPFCQVHAEGGIAPDYTFSLEDGTFKLDKIPKRQSV